MERWFSLFLLPLLLAACETLIYPDLPFEGDVLVMNARLSTADSVHTVHLAWSRRDSVAYVADAAVSCRVNGVAVATASGAKEGAYTFEARFAPGDEVVLAADAAGHHAEAAVTVPATPVVDHPRWDRVRHAETAEEEPRDYYRVKVDVHDIPGQRNFYKAGLWSSYSVPGLGGYVRDEATGEYVQGTLSVTRQVRERYVTNCYDPLLGSSLDLSFGANDPYWTADELNYSRNLWNLFPDTSFADGVHTLVLAGRCSEVMRRPSATFEPDRQYEADACIRVRVFSLSEEDWRHLNMSRADLADFSIAGLDIDVYEQTQPYPENVTGGMGFVTVEAAVDVVVDIGPLRGTFHEIFPD